jgi:autotransporter-associated beta strand protein
MRSLDTYLKRFIPATCAWTLLLTLSSSALAANGTWIESTGDGLWSNPANWSGGVIADGAGNTANFNVDVNPVVVNTNFPGFYRNAVGLDSSRTIGNMVFGDANAATPGGWEVYAVTSSEILTLSGGTPTITVNPLGPFDTATLGAVTPEIIDDAIIRPSIDGTEGFTKAGAGTLTLVGSANTITGNVNLNAGTLRLRSALPAAATINIANGATLATATNLDATGGRIFNVAPGTTANLRIEGSSELGRFVADNATLNVNIVTAGATFTPSGNWGATGSPTALNVSSTSGGIFRIAPNLSSANGGIRNFNANTFVNTAVSLDNVTVFTRTNSGGNTVAFGSLSGTSTSVLSGGGQSGGTVATYSIGSLNTDTEFAGTIDTSSAPTPNPTTNQGGLNLRKVGTGKLTLSGTLAYQPTLNGTVNRRGGVTTVAAGTLALKNSAAIPGGVTDGVTTQNSVVNINSGATLDVSGSTIAGGYNTSPLQTVVGVGSIAGNYVHDDGVLAPGDTISGDTGTTPNPNPNSAAGTLAFNNNLSFNQAATGGAGGNIKFDISPSTSSGNDLIQVNGVTTLTGNATLSPSFLGGFTTGTYTIINSTGGFSGNVSGWTVNWPGRGTAPSLAVNGNLLQMTVGPGSTGSVSWTGATDSEWVAGSTGPLNWWNNNTNAADRYFDLDTVRFADTYGAANTPVTNSTVLLNTTVTPVAVNVNNNTVNYSITGGGKITGGASLTKTGAGTLTLQTANDFTGGASLQGGTVDIGAFNGALGTGNLAMSGAKLIVANTATAGLTNSGLTLSGSSNIIEANGATNPLSLPGLSGSGDLTVTTTVQDKLVDLGSNNSGFTGDITISADGVTAFNMGARLNGAGSSLPNSVVTLNNGASLRDRATSAQTIQLGALQGDNTSNLMGYQGGSGATAKTWEIGALGLSTTFAGTITDGAGSQSTTAPTHITKVGAGTLTLTGANTYSGDTTIEAGTLSITNPYLSDLADVSLLTGATLDLEFVATDVIDSLFFNGVSEPVGTYGGIGSGAMFERTYLSGTGLLQVTTQEATPIPGDFDGNGFVDGADLAQWRGDFGGAGSDADADGDSDGNDFLVWQRNLGLGTPPSVSTAAAVPEPSSGALLVLSALAVVGSATRRCNR